MECKYCGIRLKNAGALSLHQSSCALNPDRVKRSRSPLAGSFKSGGTPWNKGRTGLKSPHRLDDNIVFVENSGYARHHIKSRILKQGLIPYICACCGLGPEWRGKPMPLILDHINGKNNDNRLENLRFVCSNCDSQLPTYKSKNIGRNTMGS